MVSIDKAFNLAEPSVDWLWDSSFSGNVKGVNFDKLIVESIDIPFINITAMARHRNATNTYYPGFSDISGTNISFVEDSSGSVLTNLYNWMKAVKDPDDGSYGLPKDYKCNVDTQLYNLSGDKTVKIRLIGIWPTNISNYSLNYTNRGRLITSASFSVDSLKIG